MAKKLYEESNISAIASAIRSKNGLSSTYTVSDMASAILSIETDPVLESLNVSVNGSYTPGTGVYGFSNVVVSVPAGPSAVLVSKTILSNGTYSASDDSADGFSEVVVSVAGGSAILDLSRSYFNGYLLPVLPEISGYSIAWIRHNTSLARFDLAIASESWFAASAAGSPSLDRDEWCLTTSNMSSAKAYTCSDGMSWIEWSDASTFSCYGTNFSRDIIWANHNIFTDNSFDAVMYASGEAISHYTPTSTFNVETLIVSANGSYSPGTGVDGFSNVVVSVPSGSGGSDDNFKITIGMMSGSIYDSEATTINTSAFYYNNAITGIEMTALQSLRSWMFYSATRLSVASFPECLSIGSNCFYYCTSLKSIYAPKVTSLYSEAFKACYALQDVIMSSLVNIYSDAFNGCKSLSNITFENCLSLSTRAFAYCSNLSTVNLPKCSVIGAEAFEQCLKLSQISLPECEILSTSAFINCSALNSIYLPVCKTISNDAFYTNHGNGAKFATLDLPVCTTIGNNAIYCNFVLSNLSVPELKYIGYRAFGSCTSLAVVSFPKCSTIGSYAFSGCIRLESLYILSESVATLGGSAFISTPMVASSYLGHFGSVFVPESLVDAYKAATNWSSIADRITAYIE